MFSLNYHAERCNFMGSNEIMHIDDYIKKISEIVKSNKTEESIVTYRGESKIYPTSCIPGIYRENFLKNYEFFEKNIFDEMRANDIAKGSSYLENAISAQHDGFPSRLLDVTYNSLVALYFACTPYYRKKEDELDSEPGKVIIFFIDKIFCPTGENITKNYKELITEKGSFINNAIFSKNHKLIDHIRINKRIIAQQGAFILFQGYDVEFLQKYMYKEIIIPANSKKTLRNELNDFFGIHTGSIYPEPENLIQEIKNKTLNIENSEFTLESELNILLYNIECESQFYLTEIFKSQSEPKDKLKEFEKVLRSYQLGILDLKNKFDEQTSKSSEIVNTFITKYNNLIETVFSDINDFFMGNVKTSKEYFFIEDGDNGEKQKGNDI